MILRTIALSLLLPLALPPQSARCVSATRTLFPGGEVHDRLLIHHAKGEVRISAGGSDRLVVQARLRQPRPGDDESAIGLELQRHNGQVTLVTRADERIIDLDIRMPAAWALRLRHGGLGDVYLRGLDGEAAVQSGGGSIYLENTGGALSAHTRDGRIAAAPARVPADSASSLTSMYGQVVLTLPPETAARILLRSRASREESDFPLRESAGGWREAVCGDGGATIRLESVENRVILRRGGAGG